MKHFGKNAVIVLALLAAGFFTAYLRFQPYLGKVGKLTDGSRVFADSTDDEVRFAVWDEAAALGEPLNTSDRESGPAVSPDGRLLVFAAGERGSNAELFVADLVGGEPVDPRPLELLNSTDDELSPSFSKDTLYFASNRAGGAGGFDLYRASYEAGRFGEVEPVGGGVNSRRDDLDPAPSPDGRRLCFSSNRGSWLSGDYDLYLAESGPTGTMQVAAIDMLNTREQEREPCFADARTLIFASSRGGGEGAYDLYRASESGRGDASIWTSPEPLAGINTERDERAPNATADGFSLWFSRRGPESSGADLDIYRAGSLELFRIPGRPVGWLDMLLLAALLLLALLAFLAKHWESVDVLYKCFLVSVLAHLLLMWWFQGLFPQGDEYDLQGPDTLFRVRLAPSPRGSDAGSRERAGSLESITRSTPAENPEPERRPSPAPELDAPLELTLASLPTPRAAPAEAPDAATSGAQPTQVASDTEPLRDSEADFEPLAGRPAEMALSAQTFEGPQELAEQTHGDPSRGAAHRSERQVRPPGAPSGERPRLASDAPRRRPGTSSGPATDSGPEVALAGPRESFVPADDSVAELSLPEPERRAPERRESSVPDRRAQTQAMPAAPLGAPSSRISAVRPDRTAGLEAPRAERPTFQPREARPRAIKLEDAPRIASLDLLRAPDPAREQRDELRPSVQPRERERILPDGPRRASRQPESLPRPERAPVRPSTVVAMPMERPVRDAPDSLGPSWERTPYRGRMGTAKELALDTHGGSEETERAVAQGLAYLASIQRPDGSWGSTRDHDDKYGDVRVGKTGLCLLAFLGAAHTPGSGTQYSRVARSAIEFLESVQDRRTGHFGDSAAYGHGIATYALAECYAMTKDEGLLRPLERALRQILRNQYSTDDRRFGGWSYYYPSDRVYDHWPRVSVTAWQVMALESARIGGLPIPDQVFDDAQRFLRGSYDRRRGWLRYSHDPERLNSGYPTLPASTPAGLFCLSLLGDDITSEDYEPARRFVTTRRPRTYRRPSDDAFVFDAAGNLYFWYYGTLAMFRCGGNLWESWNEAMKSVLLSAQDEDGSFEPISLYAQYAGDDRRDKSYTTALCVLTLEIYYRYFTPLLRVR